MREFRKTTRTGATQVWTIEVAGDQVTCTYGKLDGVMQTVTDTALPKNVGRSNYVSPEEQAINQMARLIAKKVRGGYVEVIDGSVSLQVSQTIDFTQKLPTNLSFYKPINSLSDKAEKGLKNLLLYWKRDGEAMIVVKDHVGAVQIYSRRMHTQHHQELDTDLHWVDRFDHLKAAFEEPSFPNQSIFLGELVATESRDDRAYVAEVVKSKTTKAIAIQEQGNKLVFCCWDIAFLNGENLFETTTIKDRIRRARYLTSGVEWLCSPVLFNTLIENYTTATWWESRRRAVENGAPEQAHYNSKKSDYWNQAIDTAVELGIEGFVAVDKNAKYGEAGFNFRGKPSRPLGCYKLKPEFEDDFVAMFNPAEGVGKFGTGRRQHLVGSVALYQYDSAGELKYICDCGGGKIKQDYFAAAHSDPALYPMVLKVKYAARTFIANGDKTNALQFPIVIEKRTDKLPQECISHLLDS